MLYKKKAKKSRAYNLDLDAVIKGCQKGDRVCQDKLIRAYADSLMAICMRYTKNQQCAQDALQDTFVNVLKYIKGFKGTGSFDGWIKRIAVNCSLKHIKTIRPMHFSGEVEDAGLMNSEVPEIYSSLYREDILKMMDHLPDSMRAIFNLYVIEGFAHKEIAQMLNISEQTSRATLSRARKRMINIMQSMGDKIALKYINHS